MRVRPIGVGIIGMGFMGRTHLAAYRAAQAAGLANELVAVCDQDAARRQGSARAGGNIAVDSGQERLFDPALVKGYSSPAQLLADPNVELVSICTHTTTHVELALAALAAGKHVLLEKPVALTSADAQRVAIAAAKARTLCMPAMCIRFWPGWSDARELVQRKTYGAVRSAVFRRLGSRPGWASFYADYQKSGGALFDLHVHDVDFVRACFGDPTSVTSTGTLDHVTTLYRFENVPPHVVAEGGWDHSDGWAFKMSFTIVFEHATLDYEFGRAEECVLFEKGRRVPLPLQATSGYDGEVRHILGAIAENSRELAATMGDAVAHTRMLEAERRSLETQSVVRLGR
jgi:predicted dehydrogenase